MYPNEKQKKPFRFMNMWCNFPSLINIVSQAWLFEINGCVMYNVMDKFRRVKVALKELKKVGFGDVEACVIHARVTLPCAQNTMRDNPNDLELIHNEKMAHVQLPRVKRNRFSLLLQKAKLNWLRCRDENINVFYQAIKLKDIITKPMIYLIMEECGQRRKMRFSCKPRKQQVLSTLLDMGKKLYEHHLNIFASSVLVILLSVFF